MPSAENPTQADEEEARKKLSQGLGICRSVVEDYRNALTGKVRRNRPRPQSDHQTAIDDKPSGQER